MSVWDSILTFRIVLPTISYLVIARCPKLLLEKWEDLLVMKQTLIPKYPLANTTLKYNYCNP